MYRTISAPGGFRYRCPDRRCRRWRPRQPPAARPRRCLSGPTCPGATCPAATGVFPANACVIFRPGGVILRPNGAPTSRVQSLTYSAISWLEIANCCAQHGIAVAYLLLLRRFEDLQRVLAGLAGMHVEAVRRGDLYAGSRLLGHQSPDARPLAKSKLRWRSLFQVSSGNTNGGRPSRLAFVGLVMARIFSIANAACLTRRSWRACKFDLPRVTDEDSHSARHGDDQDHAHRARC